MRAAVSILCVAALGCAAPAPAGAALNASRDVLARFDGDLRPTALPRTEAAPVAVRVAGSLRPAPGAAALPQLRRLTVAINRQGRIFDRGLPVCRARQIQPATPAGARRACGDALVGRGSVDVRVAIRGQLPFSVHARLLAFNGPRRHGHRLIVANVYAGEPPGSFALIFTVSHRRGTFGTVLSTTLPAPHPRMGLPDRLPPHPAPHLLLPRRPPLLRLRRLRRPGRLPLRALPLRPRHLRLRRLAIGHRLGRQDLPRRRSSAVRARPLLLVALPIAAALLLAACGSATAPSAEAGGGSEAALPAAPDSTSGEGAGSSGGEGRGEAPGGKGEGGGEAGTGKSEAGKGSSEAGAPAAGSGGEGAGQGAASPGPPASAFHPKPHHDSGGGSGQFRVKGGDNSVQEYGAEASAGELDRAAAALHGFLDARAERNWAAACSYLSAAAREGLAQGSAGCPAGLAALTGKASPATLREAARADVGALRAEGTRGFLIYRGPPAGTVYAVSVSRDGGAWKLDSLAGVPLS